MCGNIGPIAQSHYAGLTSRNGQKLRYEKPCAASLYSVNEHRRARDGRESATGSVAVRAVPDELQRNREQMARNTIDRCGERADRMERRSETSRFGNERRTSLRLPDQFRSECSKSLRRLHRHAEPRRIDSEWRRD